MNDILAEQKFRQREAAAFLGISISVLSRLTTAQKIECYRPASGAVVYSRSQLEEYLRASKQKAKTVRA